MKLIGLSTYSVYYRPQSGFAGCCLSTGGSKKRWAVSHRAREEFFSDGWQWRFI
ncbi:MAG: hypothetical protein ABIJ40_10770 [Bacteroidota bacterium]